MVERRKHLLEVEIPLTPREMRLLRRNLSQDPSGRNQPGLVVTRSGIPVWTVEQSHRTTLNRRDTARELGVPVREVNAALCWTQLYEDDIDRRIEIDEQGARLADLIK